MAKFVKFCLSILLYNGLFTYKGGSTHSKKICNV